MPLFDKKYLEEIFQRIGEKLPKKTKAFVLGGGAMCFRGQKDGTKDLDIVFNGDATARDFFECAKEEEFAVPSSLGKAYVAMQAYGVLENNDEFRFDIFSKKVCGKLGLSKKMKLRAEKFGTYGNLEVYLVSNEDVVLFKAVTSRPRDADDIAAVVRSTKVEWDLILEECKAQSKKEPWYGLLYEKFAEIEERHGISAPIMKELLELDRQSALKEEYRRLRKQGATEYGAIQELRKQGFTEKELAGLDLGVKKSKR